MKFNVILVLFFFIFTGFVMSRNQQEYYPSKGEQLVNSVLGQAAKIIKEKLDLQSSGSGAAMPGGPIREVTLCFDTKYPHTKGQLRNLLIKSAHELLNQVNENDEIQQFLKEKPFTIKNVQIIIYNHDKNGNTVYDPEILTAEISQSILTYRTIESDKNFKLKNQYEETYEEALKALSSIEK